MLRFIYTLIFGCAINTTIAQVNEKPIIVRTDSTTSVKNPALTKDTILRVVGKDTTKIVSKHSPRKATFRSAVLPGWGQAYNREYWKIPLVYGALGVTAGFYIYNDSWYKKSKKAYEIRIENDTSRFPEIDRQLEPLSTESLRFYRNEFRRTRDYSVLYFLLAWGLNVVDATVFAHLKDFDVSDDLSLRVQPNLDFKTSGLTFVLAQKPTSKPRTMIVP
jgi:hypothetical protein